MALITPSFWNISFNIFKLQKQLKFVI